MMARGIVVVFLLIFMFIAVIYFRNRDAMRLYKQFDFVKKVMNNSVIYRADKTSNPSMFIQTNRIKFQINGNKIIIYKRLFLRGWLVAIMDNKDIKKMHMENQHDIVHIKVLHTSNHIESPLIMKVHCAYDKFLKDNKNFLKTVQSD